MASPTGNNAEPDETTSLLTKDSTSVSGNGSSEVNAVSDVESGEVDGSEDNPLFEGQQVTRVGLLIPAVAIGACDYVPIYMQFLIFGDESGLGERANLLTTGTRFYSPLRTRLLSSRAMAA
jgi:hypothetical protein